MVPQVGENRKTHKKKGKIYLLPIILLVTSSTGNHCFGTQLVALFLKAFTEMKS